jgi:hypothetical protein
LKGALLLLRTDVDMLSYTVCRKLPAAVFTRDSVLGHCAKFAMLTRIEVVHGHINNLNLYTINAQNQIQMI